MKTAGSIIALIGGVLIIFALLGSQFIGGMKDVMTLEYVTSAGWLSPGSIIAVIVILLAFISFTFQPKVLGGIILLLAFAGIIFGGTFVDICMILVSLGGFMLVSGYGKEGEAGAQASTFQQKWWFWLLIGIICLAILYGLFALLNKRVAPLGADSLAVAANTPLAPTPERFIGQEILSVTPEQILRDYDENGYTADSKYRGNPVRVTGKIYDIKSTADGGSSLLFRSYDKYNEEYSKGAVICNFTSAETAAQTVRYKVGDTVAIVGTVHGLAGKLDDVIFENCSFDMP